MQEQQECLAKEELEQLLTQSPANVVVIDVRSPDEFTGSHIAGAVNIPLVDLERRSKELKQDAIIITACGKGGGRSAQAAAFLKEKGFEKSSFLCGGTFGWLESREIL